jgi:hypothetical protein
LQRLLGREPAGAEHLEHTDGDAHTDSGNAERSWFAYAGADQRRPSVGEVLDARCG